MQKITFTIDVEPDIKTSSYKGVKPGLLELKKILDEYHVKPTLFITCDCLERYPNLFKSLKNSGWEIALHGYRHERLDNLSAKEKDRALRLSIKAFNKYLKSPPKGFRAPQHSIDSETLKLLGKYNFDYDSSIIPWNFYHILFFWKIKVKFSHHFLPMKIHRIGGMTEIPISSFILPFSSVTLRMLPKNLLKVYFYLVNRLSKPVFFIHSWDLIELKDSKLYNLCPKKEFMAKIDQLLSFFSKRRKFCNIKDLTTN
jgi:peptidoglycan/xylan/chitin deacetylase (PgdA/CDA1 family)